MNNVMLFQRWPFGHEEGWYRGKKNLFAPSDLLEVGLNEGGKVFLLYNEHLMNGVYKS
jgi:hypothetical protein